MDFEKARFNMVEQQVRPWEVLDPVTLDLMMTTPREHFVPEAYRKLAFADTNIPLGNGQVMMPPREEARLTQALKLTPSDHVLEIGTGSGYVTALLAKASRRVTTVEIDEALHEQAKAKLGEISIGNVDLIAGDGLSGWPSDGPYDAIAFTASLPQVEKQLQRQLKPGGRLFIVVGDAPAMEALLITRVGADDWSVESLFETVLPRGIGAQEPERFVL